MNDSTSIANHISERLAASELFHNYRDAFLMTTGLRITLDPLTTRRNDPTIPTLTRLRLPVNAGEEPMAYLSLQVVSVESEEYRSFDDIARAMLDYGCSAAEVREARELLEKSPALPLARLQALETMLRMFAGQLSDFAEKLFLQATENEPEAIRKAREYISSHLGEPMALEEVAHHAGVSHFHFCKLFKRFTALTFTDFVNRARVEQAKKLLLKPRSRVTEVAYDVGFQSLSQFNRSFKRVTCQSPTEYRSHLGELMAA